jgi:cytochrome c1
VDNGHWRIDPGAAAEDGQWPISARNVQSTRFSGLDETDACHRIPGVRTVRRLVGPPLTRIARPACLAGRLPNSPKDIERWIQHPEQIDPQTVMREMNVTESDARDIAAYLYTLR